MSEDVSASVDASGTAEPHPNDVLLGRGARVMMHAGNARFRELVQQKFEEYTSVSCHVEKSLIALRIIEGTEATGGRFLKLLSSTKKLGAVGSSETPRPNTWLPETNKDVIMQKVKQAFRSHQAIKSKAAKVKLAVAEMKKASSPKDSRRPAAIPPRILHHTVSGTTESERPFPQESLHPHILEALRHRTALNPLLLWPHQSLLNGLRHETAMDHTRQLQHQESRVILQLQGLSTSLPSQIYPYRTPLLSEDTTAYRRNPPFANAPVVMPTAVFTRRDMRIWMQFKNDAVLRGDHDQMRRIASDLRRILSNPRYHELGLEEVSALHRVLFQMEKSNTVATLTSSSM